MEAKGVNYEVPEYLFDNPGSAGAPAYTASSTSPPPNNVPPPANSYSYNRVEGQIQVLIFAAILILTPLKSQPYLQPQEKPQGRSVKHPICTVFHLVWKLGALFTYLFGNWPFHASYVVVFILCIIFLSFDFWTVKNVSGRLMVGLRWWNEIKDDGSNEWIFESLEDKSVINPTEKLIFWGALFGAPVLWIVLAVVSILQLNIQWLLIVLVAIALSIANIVGYVKCAKDARNQMSSIAKTYFAKKIVDTALQSSV